MNIAPVIITCHGREGLLAATLESWSKTDFLDTPLVEVDTGLGERRDRQTLNSYNALCRALVEWPGEVDFVLFMEDDLQFNRNLKRNLSSWVPLLDSLNSRSKYFFGSLYNPNVRELSVHPDYFIADPTAVYGSQCFILSATMVREIVNQWEDEIGMQDIKMSRLAARYGSIYYHRPSLVQHVGTESTWGGGFHQCKDFEENY